MRWGHDARDLGIRDCLYLDGELTGEDARALEAHLVQCPECREFRDQRLALRAAIAAQISAFQAPDLLRQRVRSAAATTARSRVHRTFGLRGWRGALALAASLAFVAVGSWQLARTASTADAISNDVLSSHIRSLMPGHSPMCSPPISTR